MYFWETESWANQIPGYGSFYIPELRNEISANMKDFAVRGSRCFDCFCTLFGTELQTAHPYFSEFIGGKVPYKSS